MAIKIICYTVFSTAIIVFICMHCRLYGNISILNSLLLNKALYQLRNLLNRSNVPKKPKKKFDACDDFLCTLVESLLLVATLEYLQMEPLDDDPSDDVLPNASTLCTETHEKRANVLEEICGAIIDKLVSFRFYGDTIRSGI